LEFKTTDENQRVINITKVGDINIEIWYLYQSQWKWWFLWKF
jgi:hypothetical protein